MNHPLMKLALKAIRNLLVANLCAVVPLWWMIFGWMPDQVKVELRSNGNAGAVWQFYAREGMQWNDFVFQLPEGMDWRDVERVRLEKWKLLSQEKAGSGLARKDGGVNEYYFPDPRVERMGIASGKIPLGLAGAEILLLVLSWRAAKRPREEAWKTLLPPVLGVAFALALLIQVALPVQSYVANRSAFPFTPGELGEAIALRFPVAWALGGLALGLLARCFGRWILAPVLAFTACAYLESGVLSIGLPDLNGNWTFFGNRARALWDSAVWTSVFAAVFGLLGVFRKSLGIVALCLAILIGASFLDVHPEPKADPSKWIIDDFPSKAAVAHSAVYSPKNNVLVFVIDSLECAPAHAIMEDLEAGPRLREQFRGFTEYTNNIGTGDYSAVAVANLLTGKYPEGRAGIMDYYNSIFSEESVLKDYLDAGHAVFLVEDKSYTNRRQDVVRHKHGTPVMKRRATTGQRWTLPDIDQFRWLPFAFKRHWLQLSAYWLPTEGDFSREWNLYPVLADANVAPGERGTFLFVHTDGVHVPILYNRNGEQMEQADDSDAGCVEMGIHVLGQLGKLFDEYRQKGIYDDALIVVLADHGHHDVLGDYPESETNGLPGTARPFLWVKPRGSSHPFKTAGLPTSHSHVAALLRSSVAQPCSEEKVPAILETEKRLYRKLFLLTGERQDWFVAADGMAICRILPEKTGELRPVEYSRIYDLDIQSLEAASCNIRFEQMDCQWKPTLYPYQTSMKMTFKVPRTDMAIDVHLVLNVNRYEGVASDEGKCFQLHQEGKTGKRWRIARNQDNYEWGIVVLDGLEPDETGTINIIGERGEGFTSFVEFSRLQVVEHAASGERQEGPWQGKNEL